MKKTDNNSFDPIRNSGVNAFTEQDYKRMISVLRQKSQYKDISDQILRERIDMLLYRTRYSDPMNDMIFHKIFANSKDNLLTLLQTLLPESGITSVQTVDNRTFPLGLNDKQGVYDIVCKTEDGQYVNVEAQKFMKGQSRSRWAFYLADLMRRQFADGMEEYKDLRPSYCICITENSEKWQIPDPKEVISMINSPFSLDRRLDSILLVDRKGTKFKEQAYMHFKMVDVFSLIPYGNQFNIVFVNLDKMNKKENELVTELDKLLFLLKNMSNIVNPPISVVKEFGKIVDDLAIDNLNKEELEQYIVDMITQDEFEEILDRVKREKDEEIAKQGEQLAQKDEQLAQKDEQLAKQGKQLAKQGKQLAKQGKQLAIVIDALSLTMSKEEIDKLLSRSDNE